jgi:hypothetical protein
MSQVRAINCPGAVISEFAGDSRSAEFGAIEQTFWSPLSCMIDKYMRQPRLTKFEWSDRYENHFSSNVISSAWTYFLNPLYPGPKYLIQFFLIDISQKILQAIKVSVVVNHLDDFKFLFYDKKQVAIAES